MPFQPMSAFVRRHRLVALVYSLTLSLPLVSPMLSNKAYARVVNITAGVAPAGADDIGFTYTYTTAIVPVASGLGFSLDGGKTYQTSATNSNSQTGGVPTSSGVCDLGGNIPAAGANTFTIKVTPDVVVTGWWYTKNGANIDPPGAGGFPAINVGGIAYAAVPAAPAKPGPAAVPALPTTITPGNSIDYDATTGTLSINGDSVTSTPDPSDPILGQLSASRPTSLAVLLPTGRWRSSPQPTRRPMSWPVAAIRTSDRCSRFSSAIRQRANSGVASDTTLAGVSPTSPFYDPTLANVSSSFLNSVDGVMKPIVGGLRFGGGALPHDFPRRQFI